MRIALYANFRPRASVFINVPGSSNVPVLERVIGEKHADLGLGPENAEWVKTKFGGLFGSGPRQR